jgi:hypothetical protein
MRSIPWVVVCLFSCVSSRALAANVSFDVQLDECGEFVGIGLVPLENARKLVPDHYTLATYDGQAKIVVRVTSCKRVAVDGKNPRPAQTAQIGLSVVIPGSTAQIDNYLLWFVTDSGALHGKLQAAGIQNGNDPQLSVLFAPSGATGPLHIDVNAPRFPAFPVTGAITSPPGAPTTFVANWYADTRNGTLRMHTEFTIGFGSADAGVTPEAGSALAELIGSDTDTLQFGLLDSYNEWRSATLQLRPQ